MVFSKSSAAARLLFVQNELDSSVLGSQLGVFLRFWVPASVVNKVGHKFVRVPTLRKPSGKYGILGHAALVFLSLLIHAFGALLAVGLGLLNPPQKLTERVAKVTLATPKEAAPEAEVIPLVSPPVLRDPPPQKPEKTRSARPRESEKTPPQQRPEEVLGGLSESLAKTDTPSESAPAVAQGNSSELAVDPSKGDLPPPDPAAVGATGAVDYAAVAVEEAFADTSASCAGALPKLDLSEDAINAGLTKGRLVFDVIIDASGRVRQPKLLRGTGFAIDKIATSALAKIVCKPAESAGKKAIVRKEIVFEVVDY